MTFDFTTLAAFDPTAVGMFVLLILGFGFVIFWHELGHFLAAKWAGVRVEQFALGFGQALLSYRQGVGVRAGNTKAEVDRRVREHLLAKAGQSVLRQPIPEHPTDAVAGHATATLAEPMHGSRPSSPTPDATQPSLTQAQLDDAMAELGISETEYRLNWMPLGGYVKMLGQDDMDPTAVSVNPRAYNMKPVGKRMVIVSAGVVMNIILAIILFCGLFYFGFNREPSLVGAVQSQSPASRAGLQVGDRVIDINGRFQHDFTKIPLSIALLDPSGSNTITYERLDANGQAQTHTASITPISSEYTQFMPGIGIMPMGTLRAIEAKNFSVTDEQRALAPDDYLLLPNEVIVSINGQDVSAMADDLHDYRGYLVLDAALQTGQPVTLGVRTEAGAIETRTMLPQIVPSLTGEDLNILGATPRPVVKSLRDDSTAKGKLQPGDVVTGAVTQETHDVVPALSYRTLMERLAQAGANDQSLRLTVERDGQSIDVPDLTPTINVGQGRKGLGIGLGFDIDSAVVGSITPGTPAAAAGMQMGDRILAVGDEPVQRWADVLNQLRGKDVGPIGFTVVTAEGVQTTRTLAIDEAAQEQLAGVRFGHSLPLKSYLEPRQTNNLLQAAWWGVEETRDLTAKAYLVLKRMVQRTVPANNLMGPVGVIHAGSTIAQRGGDWLVWFLAMISANLAVVNFLPIPIVDGGLFCFLLLEKLTGKPPSPRLQSAAQLVGLVLIVSVFLFVTYNDILRLTM